MPKAVYHAEKYFTVHGLLNDYNELIQNYSKEEIEKAFDVNVQNSKKLAEIYNKIKSQHPIEANVIQEAIIGMNTPDAMKDRIEGILVNGNRQYILSELFVFNGELDLTKPQAQRIYNEIKAEFGVSNLYLNYVDNLMMEPLTALQQIITINPVVVQVVLEKEPISTVFSAKTVCDVLRTLIRSSFEFNNITEVTPIFKTNITSLTRKLILEAPKTDCIDGVIKMLQDEIEAQYKSTDNNAMYKSLIYMQLIRHIERAIE